MFRHIVQWTIIGETDEERKANAERAIEIMEGLRALPGVLSVTFGTDVLRTPKSRGFGLVADFANEEDYNGYLTHPDHVAMFPEVRKLLKDATNVDILVDKA